MDFWTWLASCPVKYQVDDLQGFDGVSVAFYPPSEDEEEDEYGCIYMHRNGPSGCSCLHAV
jgi:hypothetical protein